MNYLLKRLIVYPLVCSMLFYMLMFSGCTEESISYAETNEKSSLAARWPLDKIENAETPEESGYEIAANGKVFGDAAIVKDPDRGDVLKLGGTGRIDCGNPEKINKDGDFTISIWMKTKTFTKDFETLLSKGEDWGLHRVYTEETFNKNNLGFYVGGLSKSVDNTKLEWERGVTDAAWHLIVCVYKGNTLELYIDGQKCSSEAVGKRTSSDSSIVIGDNSAKLGRGFNGLIDDVRIYNSALTVTEIGNIYRGEDSQKSQIVSPKMGEDITCPKGKTVKLQWKAVKNSIGQNLYIGTDKDMVMQADTKSAEFVGLLKKTNYNFKAEKDETYWWRVDEVYKDKVIKGNVWGFNVVSDNPNDAVYPVPLAPGQEASKVYTITVNGEVVPVLRYEAERASGWGASETQRSVAVARFSFAGRARVQIGCSQNIPSFWKLSPERYQIPVDVDGKTAKFSITRPGTFVFHYGGKFGIRAAEGLTEKLIIIADPLEYDSPDPNGDKVINLGKRKIDNGGSSFVTKDIQAAIDEAEKIEGGGTVYVPAGTYNIDSHIKMKNNVRLHLEPGAFIRATTTRITGGKGMIDFTKVSNAKLTGRGTLFLNGSHYRKDKYDTPDYNNATIINIDKSNNIEVRDILGMDTANMNCFIIHSKHINVRGVKFINDPDYPNTDGIDPNDGSADVNLDDLFIQNTDDCFAPGYQEDMEDITISNAVTWNTHNGCMTKIGAQRAKFMRKVHYENIIGIQTMTASNVFTHKLTANIYDCLFKGITAENIELCPIKIETTYDGVDGDGAGNGKGRIYDIKFIGCEFQNNGSNYYGDWSKAKLIGLPPDDFGKHDLENITFDDMIISGKLIQSLKDFKDLEWEVNEYVTNPVFSSTKTPLVSIKSDILYGQEGGVNPSFKISREGDISKDLVVKYRVEGSAQSGIDYNELKGEVVIPANKSSVTLPITVIKDKLSEGIESVCIVLQPVKMSTEYIISPIYRAQVAIGDAKGTPQPAPRPKPTYNPPFSVIDNSVTYSFDGTNKGADEEISGVYENIDLAPNNWMFTPSKNGFMNAVYLKSGNIGSFKIPAGKILKSIDVCTFADNVTYTISDGVNPDVTFTVEFGMANLRTNWNKPGQNITITISAGSDAVIDNIIYY